MSIIQDQEYYRNTGKLVYNDAVKNNVEIMIQSSECRKRLMREAATAPLEDLLIEAATCISNITGDTVFLKQMLEQLERRQHEATQRDGD